MKTYFEAINEATTALIRWDNLKPLNQFAFRQFEIGENFAANLRGTLRNKGASVAALENLTDDVQFRADCVERLNRNCRPITTTAGE